MAIQLRGFRHVLIPTDQLAATRDFYTNTLGLKPFEVPHITDPDVNLDWLVSGNVELHIVQKTPDRKGLPSNGFNTSMQPHIAFEVENFAAAKATLMEGRHQILYESPLYRGVTARMQMWFRDPSGMVVELYQELPTPAGAKG